MSHDPSAIFENIGYEFEQLHYLTEAMTHKSFSIDENKSQLHNERLEFLGDSILNFVIASDLVKKFPQDPEGVLSKKRATLVNQVTLAILAQRLKLSDSIQFGPGEIKQGSPSNPRILASALEALIGAIYLDSNFEKCEKWILKLFENVEQVVDVSQGQSSDYKTRLQELTQKHKLGTPSYEVIYTSGPSHKPQFLVSLRLNEVEKSRAVGASKKVAEQAAAEMYFKELIQKLEKISEGNKNEV